MPEIVTNEQGGKQSEIGGKFTEIPPLALLEVAKIMGEGSEAYPREKDGTPNWHKIGCCSNLDHAGEHLANFLASRNDGCSGGEYMRDELSHFAARAMMALDQFLRVGP